VTAPRTIAAILLAAGSSTRFGSANKLLADVAGRALVARTAAALDRARVSEIVVVTGPDADRVKQALAGGRTRFVHNEDHARGMGTSIAAGITALRPDADGALVCPGDMPALDPALVDRIIAAFDDADGTKVVYAALADGRQRNPVLWPRRLFPALAGLASSEGGKAVLEALPPEDRIAVPVTDEGLFADIDTAEDLARYLSLRGAHGR
jgi:molybdenum cofactor cytidylyltransferase